MRIRFSVLACDVEGLQATMVGDAVYPPRVGKPFEMTFDGDMVKTGKVHKVMGEGLFETVDGNLYRVELLDRVWKAMALS